MKLLSRSVVLLLSLFIFNAYGEQLNPKAQADADFWAKEEREQSEHSRQVREQARRMEARDAAIKKCRDPKTADSSCQGAKAKK